MNPEMQATLKMDKPLAMVFIATATNHPTMHFANNCSLLIVQYYDNLVIEFDI
jgi:hypothetical protein